MKNFDTFCAMIDCSRNGVMNLAAFKKAVPVFAKMGYTALMLYTEDTYELPDEPFFGYKRGRYSMAELKEMDDYAYENGIELIPCIQTLAHMSNIFRWPCYGKIHDLGNTMLADCEDTYALIGKMLRTVRECFRSNRVHIGMDEAYMMGRGQYLDKYGAADRYEVLLRHLNRVTDMAHELGLYPLMWNDMFFKMERGIFIPGGFGDTPEIVDFSEKVRASVPKGVGLCHWDYLGTSHGRYANMLKSTMNLSDDVWLAAGVYDTMNFAPLNKRSMISLSHSIPACVELGVRNVIITIWGDVGKDCATMAALPGFMYAAAQARGLSEAEMKAEFAEITGEDFDEMTCIDSPNYLDPDSMGETRANYAMTRFYNDPFLGLMDKTADREVDTSIYALYAAKLHALAAKSANYAYAYEKVACLCDVLEIKFDLGERTRKLYAAGDKAGLKALAEGDYSELLGRMRKFYEAFRLEWAAENKDYGWEIQDMRLGGAERRVESCMRTILDYCAGGIDRIEELEEDVLPCDGSFVWFWRNMISACPHGGE